MEENPNLDILRSCAVAFVVMAHLRDFIPGWAWGYDLYPLGRLGISLFFVHTTLVLMMSLERHSPSLGPFLVRRFFRIYPLSAASVLIVAALAMFGNSPVDRAALVSNLLLVQNVTGHHSSPAQLWTLPYEVQMYVCLPALFLVTTSRKPLVWTILICCSALALAMAAWATETDLFVFEFVPCFLPGMLAYVIGKRSRQWISPVVLFAGIGIAVPLTTAVVATGVPMRPLFWGVCLALGIVLPMTRQVTSSSVAKFGKVIATYSYGIYLTHVLALAVAFDIMASHTWLVQWSVFAIMLSGLSCLAYRGIEHPGIKLGVRLSERLAGRGNTLVHTAPPKRAA
jgi:peptidoglycan/LPS O-acetylase OafA/YrhL